MKGVLGHMSHVHKDTWRCILAMSMTTRGSQSAGHLEAIPEARNDSWATGSIGNGPNPSLRATMGQQGLFSK